MSKLQISSRYIEIVATPRVAFYFVSHKCWRCYIILLAVVIRTQATVSEPDRNPNLSLPEWSMFWWAPKDVEGNGPGRTVDDQTLWSKCWNTGPAGDHWWATRAVISSGWSPPRQTHTVQRVILETSNLFKDYLGRSVSVKALQLKKIIIWKYGQISTDKFIVFLLFFSSFFFYSFLLEI